MKKFRTESAACYQHVVVIQVDFQNQLKNSFKNEPFKPNPEN